MSNSSTETKDKTVQVIEVPGGIAAELAAHDFGEFNTRKDVLRENKKLFKAFMAGRLSERAFKLAFATGKEIYAMMLAEDRFDADQGQGEPFSGLLLQFVSTPTPKKRSLRRSKGSSGGALPPAPSNGAERASESIQEDADITAPVDIKKISRIAR